MDEKPSDQPEIEKLKSELSLHNELRLQTEKAVLEYAQTAIRWAIIGNGALATGLLTMIKSKNGCGALSPLLFSSVIIAAFGASFGFAATIFAYFNQWQHLRLIYRNGALGKPGMRWERKVGIVCLVLAVVAFVAAVICAALSQHLPA